MFGYEKEGRIRLGDDAPVPAMLSPSSTPSLPRWKTSGSTNVSRGRLLKATVLSLISIVSIYLFTTLYLVPALRIYPNPLAPFAKSFPTERHLSLIFPLSTLIHLPLSVIFARVAPAVTLRQGTVVGKLLADTSYPRSVEAFLGIPYALPPTGERRFMPPEPVVEGDGEIDASQYGKRCPSRPLRMAFDWSEDCLTANVFRPANMADDDKLPVSVYIHGGAFNSGAGMHHDDATMMAWSEEPYIAVNFNYRLGVLGFPSGDIPDVDSYNLGLKDQILLLQWVQDNIEAFGGDPSQVTVWGVSSGAHSIGHLMLNEEISDSLFHRAMLQSGGPTSRATPPPDAPLPSYQFDELVAKVGCADKLDDEIMSCLRSKSSSTIGQASIDLHESYFSSNRWPWQPVVDGNIIKRTPFETWKSGKWNKVPVITGFTTNEGSPFVDDKMDTSAAFTAYWRNYLPKLPDRDIRTIDRMYPDPLIHPESPYVETRPLNVGSQYRRIEAAYSHCAYICPVRQMADITSAGQMAPVFMYHWALNKSMHNAAGHAEQVPYEQYLPSVRAISPAQEELAGHYHAYLTSFITTGDPSKIKGKYGDRPKWEAFESNRDHRKEKVMIFGRGNDERAGGTNPGVASELIDNRFSAEDCDFWWDKTPLTKS